MKIERCSLIACIGTLSILMLAAQSFAGDCWKSDPPPKLTSDITVGSGNTLSDGGSLVLVEGDTVNLSATSSDQDTKCSPGHPDVLVDDTANVVWSSSNGGLPATTRVASGAPIVFTAPNVPTGQTTLSIDVTAQPDDNTTTNPGNILTGDTGNRNDAPGKGIKITVKVIKNCPVDVAIGDNCVVTQSTLFLTQGTKTDGARTYRMDVSGGTPPNPPNNWNGLFIKEAVAYTGGTLTNADLIASQAGLPAASCVPSVQGFVLGETTGMQANCAQTKTDNAFWDAYRVARADSVLVAGSAAKTVICSHKYFCNQTQLHTGATNNAFNKTATFTLSTFDPDGTGPLPAYPVTNVTYDKVPN